MAKTASTTPIETPPLTEQPAQQPEQKHKQNPSALETQHSANRANASNVLRGIVILAVLINHYFDHFTSVERSNIANTMVVVFFVLSGYGISFSLHKKLGDRLSFRKLLSFYKIRVARIFPLLWIALLLQSLVVGQPYSLSAFLGYGLTGHYWFISSILECYLLSPFLARFLNDQKHAALAVMTFLLLASNYLIGVYPALKSALMTVHLTSFPYLEIYFINIYLFFCGMYFQRVWKARFSAKETRQRQGRHDPVFWILLTTAIAYTVIDRFFWGSLPFIGSVFLFVVITLYALTTPTYPRFWGSQAMLFAGRHSLALYLLHIPFYFLFAQAGVIQMDSVLSALLCIGLLPLFLAMAIQLEQLAQRASSSLLSLRWKTAKSHP